MNKDRERKLLNRIQADISYFGELSKEEQTNRIINYVLDRNNALIMHIKDERKKTYSRCLRAVRVDFGLAKYVPEEIREEIKEKVKEEAKKSGGIIIEIEDIEITPEYFLPLIIDDWNMLRRVPVEMQTDEMINIAMKQNLWAFKYIKDDRMKTLEMCLRAVKYNWELLEDVPEDMQTDEVIDAAMEEDIDAFRHIIDDNKKTIERCLRAVRYKKLLLWFVPEELKERVEEEIRNG